MISHPKRGPGRGSYIGGCSVRNQRIERLWGDVFYDCTSYFHEFFSYLEIRGYLDVENPIHLWSLQYVFQPRIDELLHRFATGWNTHPISPSANKTPEQVWILGIVGNRQEKMCLEQVSNRVTITDVKLARLVNWYLNPSKYKLIYYRDVAFKKCDNAWKICKTFTKTSRLEKNCHQS